MTTRDEYNETEWDKFVAETPGTAPPIPLKCSSLNCNGNIIDKAPNIVITRDDGLPQKIVECDTCDFGTKYRGWRIANHI